MRVNFKAIRENLTLATLIARSEAAADLHERLHDQLDARELR